MMRVKFSFVGAALTILVFCVGSFLVTNSCNSKNTVSSDSSKNLRAEPDYRGTTKSVTRHQPSGKDTELATLLLENVKGVKVKDGFDKLIVRITKETQIYLQDGENRLSATLDALTENTNIEFMTTGDVMTSNPAQVIATEIIILKK